MGIGVGGCGGVEDGRSSVGGLSSDLIEDGDGVCGVGVVDWGICGGG